ncbi:ABC transporter ATP-binding protein, partial [Pseudomonas syringae pv. tagetis]
AQRIHRLQFDEGDAGPVEQELNIQDIRIAY